MATHSYTGADATINDTEYLALATTTVSTRHLGSFINSDLSAFCPLAMDNQKSIWLCGRSYFSNSTYQPKTGDVPSDGSGHLALTVTNVANAGWYQFLRTLPTTLWVGNDTVQNANGLYVDFDFEFSATGQAHRIGAINPHYYDSNYAIPPSLSLHNSQYDLRGYEEDTTASNSSNSGSSLAINTHYYARETFGTNSITLKIYTSDANRTNDASVFRTCTCSNIDVMRVQAVGAFVRYNDAGSVLKIYNFGGTVCNWYGENVTATFDAVDYGSTQTYVLFSTAANTISGDVKYQYRIQSSDDVWDAWTTETYTLAQLQKLDPVQCYAVQFRAIFNECNGASVASLSAFSFDSSTSVVSFDGITALNDNGDGTLTVQFDAATGAERYEISIHTSSMSDGDLDDRTYLVGAVDEDSSSDYSYILSTIAGGTAKLTAGTEYYVAVRALTSANTNDGNTENLSTTVTNPRATSGPVIVIPDTTPVQLDTSATTIYEVPANKRAVVLELVLCNTDTSARTVSLYKVQSGDSAADDVALLKSFSLKAAGELGHNWNEVMKLSLTAGTKIQGIASVASKVTATISVIEVTP